MFTAKQVKERLSVSLSTVYNLVETGQLECHRIGAGRGCIRISEEQLKDYLERSSRRRPPKGEEEVYNHLDV
jgi:excisionase family DNA binding protein